MKLAVINFSGNVGKTTVARHLLAPRIPGCQVVSVESINADDGQPVTIRGRQFAQLQEFLQSVDDVVIDIGASNVEDLLKLMRRYRGSQDDFDAFVVPTVPARKQQQDTAATLAELARIGVPATRLRLVFNQADDDSPVEQAFETLLAYCAASGVVQPRTAACMTYNEVYARIRGTGQSLTDLAADATDYKAAIANAHSTSDKLALVQKLATCRLARGVVPELDACFAALELQVVPSGHDPPGRAARGVTGPATAREALIVEAIGDVAKLIREVEALAPALDERCRALQAASTGLQQQLSGLESRIAAITENAKAQTVKHLSARADEAARRSVDQQSRAMADAARVAFGVECGALVQRLQATLQPLVEQRKRSWDPWLTHAAAAAAASAATWALVLYAVPR